MAKTRKIERKTQDERREYTRKALLQSTIKQIAKSGLNNCKLSDIVLGAKVTTGAVQHLFGNRDGLILSAIEDIFSQTTEAEKSLERKGDMVARMKAQGTFRIDLVGTDIYRALIDIVVNSRYDTPLGKKMRKRLLQQGKAYEEWFVWYMDGLGLPTDKLIMVEKAMASSLYGLEMLSISRWNMEEYKEILDYTIEAHINMLQS
ncbi:MAG: AcrR family transcriptional regulator [Oceanicoccus sp.]|jgi:AcrR family transcriptional regulator